ncbi:MULTISPECIES: SprT family protein [Amylolactobacillus]|uniref:SprT family protein n=1 Tax=Amylolactobacillus amylophilus DSM 20533 = JCM 1125 TaxID=1423721 RepID=A0A1L6XD01_9LACO|nr:MULTISPECIES: SprT family protein [Amylolactobacillus]APT18853.1 SprT family protein [Amylolactobacillus amylophilus DSM 20533 = JCM 1125]
MTQQELQQLVEQISLEYFKRPFRHRVVINHRFKTTGGRYHLADHHLEFNPAFLTAELRTDLIGIVKHELTHYHLHLLHRGYRHQDRDFKVLLQQVGGSRFALDVGNRRPQAKKFHYICTNCGQQYHRVKRIDTRRYRCGVCSGILKITTKM